MELLSTNSTLPEVDPVSFIGMTFLKDYDDGSRLRNKVKECQNFDDPVEDQKYLVGLENGDKDDILNYGQLMEHLGSNKNDEDHLDMSWKMNAIEDHKCVDGSWTVLVTWKDGSSTWEPLRIIRKENPIVAAKYAYDNGLLYKPGWRSLRRYAKNKKKIARLMRQVELNAKRCPRVPLCNYGVRIPRTYAEELKFYE